ncbi:MFS transporter [Candidatus Chloroploca sp. Khr17]|uniref:MFS transporter n=1 Tax=Candidatus Chloroploca sp. Khr17 TaxID=2496869 RepID=UPI00101E1878|nr:MFS transporter [Candidatus Chloroploca sp. Khr17]
MAPIVTSAHVARISPPVWRILLHSVLFGLALNIADLLFNFYLVSLGYGPDTAGLLSTVSRGAGMLFGVPLGLLIDRVGAQRAIIAALATYCFGWIFMLQATALWALIGAQFVIGASFLMATMAVTPLLASVTFDRERTNAFGLNASATLMIGLVGSILGGMLPTLAAGFLGVGPQETAAYRLALSVVIGLSLLAMLPLLRPLPLARERHESGLDAPIAPPLPLRRLLRFALAGLFLGIGGGMILPFQNLFFRTQFGLNDAAVGVVLAVVALGMGIGALLGPPVTKRIGLRRGAALLRMWAIAGMLMMLAPALLFAVVGFFLRGLFISASFPMNDALVMRYTPINQRGMAASLLNVLWAGGWALAAVISGFIQVQWGFTPIIILTVLAYLLSGVTILTLRIPDEDG